MMRKLENIFATNHKHVLEKKVIHRRKIALFTKKRRTDKVPVSDKISVEMYTNCTVFINKYCFIDMEYKKFLYL